MDLDEIEKLSIHRAWCEATLAHLKNMPTGVDYILNTDQHIFLVTILRTRYQPAAENPSHVSPNC